jgi:hypothetical protein
MSLDIPKKLTRALPLVPFVSFVSFVSSGVTIIIYNLLTA